MDISKIDLYGLFEVSPDASTQEIKTAYRRKARKVHPDKNPDDPEAAKLFHQLSEALKILLDETAKAAYDRVLKSKKEAEIRNSKLDATRKKFKDKLEAQEKEHQLGLRKSPEELLKTEIERVRKQNLEYLAREQEIIRQELANERRNLSQTSTLSGTLKLRWKNDSEEKEFYTHEKLLSIFSKYGDISALIISTKGKGSAIVEYYDKKDADLALSMEKGNEKCPLKLSWVQGENRSVPTPRIPSQTPVTTKPAVSQPSASYEDYEAKVLQMMLEAEAKKRKMTDTETTAPKQFKDNM